MIDRSKPLYCVSYEVFQRGEWKANHIYMHANDAFEARCEFARGCPAHYKVGINIHIAGVALVIGGHAQDDHGDRIII